MRRKKRQNNLEKQDIDFKQAAILIIARRICAILWCTLQEWKLHRSTLTVAVRDFLKVIILVGYCTKGITFITLFFKATTLPFLFTQTQENLYE